VKAEGCEGKKGVSRRERERQRHREEILAGAERLFAEKGFHATTMEDVAAAAEFAVGTIYNFFASKEQLYHTLIGERFAEVCQAGHAMMDEATDPVGVIRAFVEAKVRLAPERLSFVKLYTRDRMSDRFANNAFWRDTVGPLYMEWMERLVATFAAGIEEGVFRGDVEPVDMAIAIDGLTDGFMYDWLTDARGYAFADKLEAMWQLVLGGVRRK